MNSNASARKAAMTGSEMLDALSREPYRYDFYQAMRRLECAFRDRPRWGTALLPSHEPVRLGQEATLAVAPGSVASFTHQTDRSPARLLLYCFGMLGPNGALPLHLTDYARQRSHQQHDPTFSRFLDLFHHRMTALFYRAWAIAQPAVQHDRVETDRFATYVGSLAGYGMPSLRGRDELSDNAKLYYAGLLLGHTRNAEGLAAFIGDYLRLPARITQFVGEWVTIPPSHAWHLAKRGRPGTVVLGKLGSTAMIGTRVWMRQHRFRVVLGPLKRDQFRSMLPGGENLARLRALVRTYAGDELKWDVELRLSREALKPAELGKVAQLGRTSWLVAQAGAAGWEDLILDPMQEVNQPPSAAQPRARSAPSHVEGVANV
jgi:type VI secretion system protein ImpH